MTLVNNDKSKRTIKITLGKFAMIVALAWIFMYARGKTINFPDFSFYTLALIVSISLFAYSFKSFFYDFDNLKSVLEKSFLIGLAIVTNFLFGFMLTCIFFIPFSYYNIYASQSNATEVLKCKILGVTDYKQNSCVYYEYKGRYNLTYGHRAVMSRLSMDKNYDDYLFVADAKPALFETYIIQSWQIEPDNSN